MWIRVKDGDLDPFIRSYLYARKRRKADLSRDDEADVA